MADNYLERRRELYEIRKAEWLKKKRHMPVKPHKAKESSTTSQERDI